MTESTGVSSPPPAPQKLAPWIIVVVVIVVVCCFCVGAIGLLAAFGEPILHELGFSARLVSITIG